MAITVGYSAGFLILVGLAIIVGYKFYHDHHMMTGVGPDTPGTQPNSANPATGGGLSLKY
jgi:hypothetical protein